MSMSSRPDAWFLAAATLSALTAGIHVFAGGPEVMIPLARSDAPVLTQAVLDVVWHQVTLLLAGAALVFLLAAFRPAWRAPVAVLVGLHFAAIAVLFVVLGLRWFGGVWSMPQWVLFTVMAGLAGMGLRRRPPA